MTAAEIQKIILDETGIKTSVRKLKGSMNGYVRIMPIYQNNTYPSLPLELVQRLAIELAAYNYEEKPLFCGRSDISIYGIDSESTYMKREAKQKEPAQAKGWGSKNSQIRLDKAVRRNAVKLRKGGVAGYW